MIKNKNNVTIRSAEIRDIELLAAWWSNGKVMEHAGFPKGLKTNKNRLKTHIQTLDFKSDLMIIEASDYRIGEMNYNLIDDYYEIGIKICDINEQGKGYGEIAIKLLIEHIFQDLSGKKIKLDTNLNNIGAQKFYERIGFERIGIRENCWTDQLGVLQSAVDYQLIKTDYYK